jgi:PAS domain S-box-containing protein
MRRLRASAGLAFELNPWLECVLKVRRNWPAAYAAAIAAVAIALGLRVVVAPFVGAHVPFSTFYPAVIAAALMGGVGPAILATMLSALVAWYGFLPPELSWSLEPKEDVEILLFLAVNGINITIAAVLSAMVERLVAQNSNIRLLLDSAREGIAVVDEHGSINLANLRLARIFGYRPEELAGTAVADLVSPHGAGATFEEASARSIAATVGAAALQCQHKDGSSIQVELRLHQVQHRRRRGMLATVTDLSERERAETNRRMLEHEVTARGNDLRALHRLLVQHAAIGPASGAEVAQLIIERMDRAATGMRLPESGGNRVSLSVMVLRPGTSFEGDDVALPPRLARLLGLVSSELEANSRLNGALSVADGSVRVRADVEGRHLLLLWRELDGPPADLPAPQSFAAFVLLDMARHFRLNPSLDVGTGGLRYRLHIDLNVFEPQGIRGTASVETLVQVTPASGLA